MIKQEEEERLEGSPVSDKAEIEEDEEEDEEEEEEEDEDENIDVEETDEIVEELLDGSDTSCSAGSPHIASSPSAMASLLGGADSPQSSSDGSSASVNAPATVPSSSGPEKRHICEMCGKGFPYLSILESHKRCHTGEKPFHCKHCDKSFAQKATLQVHERTHTGERPYKCRYCEKTFAQYGTKTVHEKSAHLGIRNYKCPKCDKCLSSPSALYTHKKTHGEKTFKCEFCPKTFTLKNYLKLHVKQVHEQNERKHVCRYCGKSFAYAGSLQVHVRTHTGERPYSCRFCPKAFASQGNLQSHERTHTGERPYSCGTCGRSFIQKSQLTAHEATHAFPPLPTSTTTPTGVEPERKGTSQYVCKYCGKAYQYASSLYVHTRLHTGERPFSCQFCDKRFTNQGNMQVHQRVHTGERPYSCTGCGKSYAQKVGLKIHLEQCQPYLENRSNSESPINVDTDSDCSDESKKMEYAPVPNIYKDCSPPLLPPLPSYAQLSLPDLGLKLQSQTQKLSSFHPLPTPPSLSSFRAPEVIHFLLALNSDLQLPADFGPLAASKPPSFQLDITMPEALSAFSTPVKAQTPPPSLLDTSLLLKGLLENINQGNALLQQPLLNTNHLLSTQLLLQQLGGHHHDLSSLLHQSTPSLSSSLLGSLLTPSLMCPQFKDLA